MEHLITAKNGEYFAKTMVVPNLMLKRLESDACKLPRRRFGTLSTKAVSFRGTTAFELMINL